MTKPHIPDKPPTTNRAYYWAFVVASIAVLAAWAGAQFGWRLPGVASAVLAVVLFLPVMSGLVLFAAAARVEKPSPFSRVMLYGYGVVAFVMSVLLVTSAFFGWPLGIRELIVPPEPNPPDPVVEVLARDALWDPLKETIVNGQRGFIKVPPKHQVRFVSAATSEWTNDQFGAIETLVRAGPITVDLRLLIRQYDTVGKDWGQYEKWLRSQVDQLIKEGLTGGELPPGHELLAQMFENMVVQYVREDVVPLIDSEEARKNRYLTIDATIPPARQFWKRVITMNFRHEGKVGDLMGPYFRVGGTGRIPEGAGFPTIDQDAGSLVGGIATSDSTPTEASTRPDEIPIKVKAGTALPFFDRDHVIRNDSDRDVWVRLGINDNITNDNGSGKAWVTYRLEPIK